MAKLIILSIVLASFTVPVWFANTKAPRRGVRNMQRVMIVFILVWAYLCLHWYPALVPIE